MYTFGILDDRTGNPNGGLTTGGFGSGGFGNGGFGNTGIGGSSTSTAEKDIRSKADILDSVGGLISGIGNGAGALMCAIKGTCANTTVIHQAPQEASPKKSNTAVIVLSVVFGLPIVVFIGIFISKLFASKKEA